MLITQKSRTKGTIIIEAQAASIDKFTDFVNWMKSLLKNESIIVENADAAAKDPLYRIYEMKMSFKLENIKPFDEMLKSLHLGTLLSTCKTPFRILFNYVSFEPVTERLYTESAVLSHGAYEPTLRYEQLDYDEPILTGEALTDDFELYRPDEILQLGDADMLRRFIGSDANKLSPKAIEAYCDKMDGHFAYRNEVPLILKAIGTN